MRLRALLFCCGLAAGCSGPKTAPAPDLAEFESDCGRPGDVGNSLGVGMFCTSLGDCSDNKRAKLCTKIADPDNFFCTMRCEQGGPPDQCGEDAICACQGACGCVPLACWGGPPP